MSIEVYSPQELDEQGKKHFAAERFQEALTAFEAAARGFRAKEDELSAAEMENNRSVVLLKLGDAEGAYEVSAGTDKTFAQAGDRRRQAMALGNQAAALEALDQPQAALDLYRQSADLLKDVNEPDLRSYVLQSISSLQIRMGDQLGAMASMDSALSNRTKLSWREKILKKLLDIPLKKLKG